MKKTIFFLFLILSFFYGFTQNIVLKGTVIKRDICKLEIDGYKILLSEKITNCFAKITGEEFVLTNSIYHHYDLYDKQVEGDGDNLIVHFLADERKKTYIIALRECEGNILVGVFPTDGTEKFVQYTIKLYNTKKNGRN